MRNAVLQLHRARRTHDLHREPISHRHPICRSPGQAPAGEAQSSRSRLLRPGMPIPGSKRKPCMSGSAASCAFSKNAGVSERVALFYPQVREGSRTAEIMIHSKVMIVDDVFLRVGIGEPEQPLVRSGYRMRPRLRGNDARAAPGHPSRPRRHARPFLRCGRGRGGGIALPQRLADRHRAIAQAMAATASSPSISKEPKSELCRPWRASPIPNARSPRRPSCRPSSVERPRAQPLRRFAKIIGVGIVIVALILAWRFTALSALAHPDHVRQWLSGIAEMPAAPLIVLATFVVGGLLVFPVLLLIAATAAAFGPWLGFALASTGAIASAIVTYGVGAAIGRRTMKDLGSPPSSPAPRHRPARRARGGGDPAGSGRAIHAGQPDRRCEQNSIHRLCAGHDHRHGSRSYLNVGVGLLGPV